MMRAQNRLANRDMRRQLAQLKSKARTDATTVAIVRASHLTEPEIAVAVAPYKHALKRLREGVATQQEHNIFLTMVDIALAVEDSGLVRGMRAHLDAAKAAMLAISDRAQASGNWTPGALYFNELEAIDTALWLHTEQVRRLAWIELHNIVRKLIAQSESAGVKVENISMQEAMKC